MKKTFVRYMTKKSFTEWKKLFLNEDAIGFNYLNSAIVSSVPHDDVKFLVKFTVEVPDKKKVKKHE